MRIRRIGRQFHQDLEIRPSFKKDEMLVSTQKKKPARFLLLRSELCPVYLCDPTYVYTVGCTKGGI